MVKINLRFWIIIEKYLLERKLPAGMGMPGITSWFE
jgi:hypothetical protein